MLKIECNDFLKLFKINLTPTESCKNSTKYSYRPPWASSNVTLDIYCRYQIYEINTSAILITKLQTLFKCYHFDFWCPFSVAVYYPGLHIAFRVYFLSLLSLKNFLVFLYLSWFWHFWKVLIVYFVTCSSL